MKEFLVGYTPEDSMFTSVEEIRTVQDALELDKKTEQQLRDTRNEVVKFYSAEYEKERTANGLNQKADNLWQGMMSVTAVIDHTIITKFKGEV